MPAIMQCKKGHIYTTAIIDDDLDTNILTVKEPECPECGEDAECVDEDYDDEPI